MKPSLSVCLVVGLTLLAVALVAIHPWDIAYGLKPDSSIADQAASPAQPVSPTLQLARTGQRTCYHLMGAVVDCTGTGHDGDIQAGVTWPDPRFEITYCDNAGPCANQSQDCDDAPGTDIVRDLLTGLVWTRSGNTLPSAVTWNESLDFASNLTLCGYDDWRLPNAVELESLMNSEFHQYWNWMQYEGFVDVLTSGYWSSTAAAAHDDHAWVVYPLRGYARGYAYSEERSTWPVRDGQTGSPDPAYPANLWRTGQTVSVLPGDDGDLQMGVAWPEPRFTNPDGTVPVTATCVLDNLTGLMWPRDVSPDPYETGNWSYALARANDLSLCGYEDWRLPNKREILSLLDFSQFEPALPPGHPFLNAAYPGFSDYHATSTTYPALTGRVYEVDLGGSEWFLVQDQVKDTPWFYVMPVRGGTVGIPLRPDLSINYDYGKPGSLLTITGLYWAPNGTVYAEINGYAIGEPITVSGAGEFAFCVDTGLGEPGHYRVEVTITPPKGAAAALANGQEAMVGFWLDEDAPLREWDGTEPIFELPAGIACDSFAYLPVAVR